MYAALPLAEVLDERRNDLKVELVKETFDRQMLGIKAAIAKLELDNIRDRMIMGRKVRIERGEPAGGPVKYGYLKDENKRLILCEAEASIIRKILIGIFKASITWRFGGDLIRWELHLV